MTVDTTQFIPLISDALWQKCEKIINVHDPQIAGRKRTNQRKALDGILYREIIGCGWNSLPKHFGDDSSINRTYRRWLANGTLMHLYELVLKGA